MKGLILNVSASAYWRTIIESILESEGFEVVSCLNPEAAGIDIGLHEFHAIVVDGNPDWAEDLRERGERVVFLGEKKGALDKKQFTRHKLLETVGSG